MREGGRNFCCLKIISYSQNKHHLHSLKLGHADRLSLSISGQRSALKAEAVVSFGSSLVNAHQAVWKTAFQDGLNRKLVFQLN